MCVCVSMHTETNHCDELLSMGIATTKRLCVLLDVDLQLRGGGRQLSKLGNGHREHSVFELGGGEGHVGGLGQPDAALHGAVGALQRMVLVGIGLVGVLALGFQDQSGAFDGHLEVFSADSRKIGQNLELLLGLDEVTGEQGSKLLGQVVAACEVLITKGIKHMPGIATERISSAVLVVLVVVDGCHKHLLFWLVASWFTSLLLTDFS